VLPLLRDDSAFWCLCSQLDLSENRLCGVDRRGDGTYTAEGIKAVADALRVSASLTSLNLSSNRLCGVWDDYDYNKHEIVGRGTYTAEGIKAVADALRVSASLTFCDVSGNSIGDVGMSIMGQALLSSTTSKLGSLKCDAFVVPADAISVDLSNKQIRPAAATLLAGVLKFNASLTKISLGGNQIGDTGAVALGNALRGSKVLKLQELELWRNNIGPEGAKAIAAYALVSTSLTSV
jgi:hypothetical protein